MAFLLVAGGPLAAQEAGAATYRLKANDSIALNVFQEAELQTQVRLTVAGEASFPLIGTVRLAGLTLKEAEELLTKLYDADYLVSPKLSINLMNAADQQITVMGAVNNPGVVGIPADATLDLVSAISSAGGLAAHADATKIELKRDEKNIVYALSDLQKKGALQVVLQHGDRIHVPVSPFANKTVTVVGQVLRPGAVNFPVGGGLDVATAIGVAGGLSDIADADRITVKRGSKVYSTELSSGVQPGDVISVPKSRFVGKTVTISGQIARPGPVNFPLDGRLSVLEAVAMAGGVARLGNRRKITVTRRTGGKEQTWRIDLEDMSGGKVEPLYLAPGDTIFVPERRF
ncbi:MAG: hypothetical protein HKN82_02010 [Akkermansiaceae bacterium]|nr:hypothetical protein [Akkermansiaceae bacterium]